MKPRSRKGRDGGAVLTRDWILAVRRGWLSLLHPKIEGWKDVFAAFGRLEAFVDNLLDQVRYEHPAPAFVIESFAPRRAAILDAFVKLREKLRELRDHAKTAYDFAHDRIPFPTPQYRASGERSLELYKKDFGAMLETHVPQRVNVKKGRYNPSKSGHLTFYVDKVLELLRQEAATIERSMEVSPEETRARFSGEYTSFDLGRMKVIVDDRTLRPGQIRQYAALLREAQDLFRRKRLDKLWCGRVIIECEACGGVNPYVKEFGVGGLYTIESDVIRVYVRPTKFLVELIAHEIGHRYWYKRGNEELRARFMREVKVYDSALAPPPAIDIEKTTRKAGANVAKLAEKLQGAFDAVNIALGVVEKGKKAPKGFDLPEAVRQAAKAFDQAAQELREAWSGENLFGNTITDFERVSKKTRDLRTDFILDMYEVVYALHEWSLSPSTEGLRVKVKRRLSVFAAAGVSPDAVLLRERAYTILNKIEAEFLADVRAREEEREKKYAEDPRVPAVSWYGRMSISEAFAEVFAFYMTGQNLTRDQIRTFTALFPGREGFATGRLPPGHRRGKNPRA